MIEVSLDNCDDCGWPVDSAVHVRGCPGPRLEVVTIQLSRPTQEAIRRARHAVERERQALEPWKRDILERIEGDVREAVERAILGEEEVA